MRIRMIWTRWGNKKDPQKVDLFWQGLADEFGTFDWEAIYQDMCVFPRVAVRMLGWERQSLYQT